MTKDIILYFILPICGYFIGSLSPAVILSKKVANIDIREEGSKNAGSTNVFRVLGPKWGLLNFVFDLLKGLVPTLIGLLLLGELGAVLAAAGVLLGHAFPVFSHFRGGKCVASMTGVIFILYPLLTLIVFVYAIAIILLTHYVSLASVTSFVIISISVFVFQNQLGITVPVQIFTVAASALIIFLHRENIVRLLKGNENKLRFKKNKE